MLVFFVSINPYNIVAMINVCIKVFDKKYLWLCCPVLACAFEEISKYLIYIVYHLLSRA